MSDRQALRIAVFGHEPIPVPQEHTVSLLAR